jgi:hypothetical protein
MVSVPGFAYFPVEFDKRGQAANKAQIQALEDHIAANKSTDLIAISHGWNNDMREADALYQELLTNARALLNEGKFPSLSDRKFAVLGILWPSKKFAEKDLIPSGAAGVANTVEIDAVRAQLDALQGGFDAADGDAKLKQMKQLLPKLEDSDKACRQFIDLCRSLVEVKSADDEAEGKSFFELESLDLFKRLEQPASFVAVGVPPAANQGGAAGFGDAQGSAAGLGDFFSGVISGARNALNYTTYYQMKERAGLIGSTGVNPLLHDLRKKQPNLRIHLIGHSFGGRVVAAIAAGVDDASTLPVSSISLLQAAFSHHGFSANWDGNGSRGFFRRVIDRNAVAGPVVITCTTNDKAVGVAYPLASLVAGQNASGLGDKDSPYGGLGRNGAQKSDAIELKMIKDEGAYRLTKGKLHNLQADACIKDHGDVRNRSVALGVLSAIEAS